MLSEHPTDGTHSVYVKGQVVTTLRFEQPVDASKTKMLGWEGRLEPLEVVRNKVILEPIRDLHRDEGILLVVTLVDGTEIPFLVRPPWREKDSGGGPPMLDQQGVLMRDMGILETTTRLYGQVWTSGPQVVIRYYKAHPPDGDEVPICAVARLSEDQMRKRPESKPGTAILDGSMASVVVVNAFR